MAGEGGLRFPPDTRTGVGCLRRRGAMQCGPIGEKRPVDVIGCSVTAVRIAAGEVKDHSVGNTLAQQENNLADDMTVKRPGQNDQSAGST